jgi:hypothetical protein
MDIVLSETRSGSSPSPKQPETMTGEPLINELLNDEQLSVVNGGGSGDGTFIIMGGKHDLSGKCDGGGYIRDILHNVFGI